MNLKLNTWMREYTMAIVGKAIGFQEYRTIYANLPFIPQAMKEYILNHNTQTHIKHYKMTTINELVKEVQAVQVQSNAGCT
jgi:hypothetical protein